MKRNLSVIVLAVAVLAFALTQANHAAPISTQNYNHTNTTATDIVNASNEVRVYEVCNAYRQTPTPELYRDCGEWQQATSTEFICSANSTAVNVKCDVEAK